jgi:predicted RNA-binding Zn-ribbon protein involved in translation (DUF1610 family)
MSLAPVPFSSAAAAVAYWNSGDGGDVLEMRTECERCGRELAVDGAAVICSFECTFCADCGEALLSVCPNCGGELVARPRRQA